MNEEIKRVFFGVEVHAPWPLKLPHGRLLDEEHRHLTLAFLGNIPFHPLLDMLKNFSIPSPRVGTSGKFDRCLLLPKRHPNVVAWQASWYSNHTSIVFFQKELLDWLAQHNLPVDGREWLPHVTLCRRPFDAHAWERNFVPIPFFTQSLHLYESVGNLVYKPIWSLPVCPPFEELEHTADIAFKISGESYQELYVNAFTALAFKFCPLLDFYFQPSVIETIDDIVICLNDVIAKADSVIGAPFKAVSFHGEAIILPDKTLQWEMIVDV